MKAGGELPADEIVALETELEDLLRALDYIEDSAVTLFYPPENAGTLCFQANLLGENLGEHIGEISDMVEETLGSCDWERSSIVDRTGAVYPAR